MLKQIFMYLFVITFVISGCSQSGRRQSRQSAELAQNRRESSRSESSSNRKTVVKVEKEHGVKYIWVEINGLKLKFVFDTGASSVSTSSAEAAVLYEQGALSDADIIKGEIIFE